MQWMFSTQAVARCKNILQTRNSEAWKSDTVCDIVIMFCKTGKYQEIIWDSLLYICVFPFSYKTTELANN